MNVNYFFYEILSFFILELKWDSCKGWIITTIIKVLYIDFQAPWDIDCIKKNIVTLYEHNGSAVG